MKISQVISYSDQTYGKFGNHRAVVKFEGNDQQYSAFVKDLPNVGDEWEGETKTIVKDGKTYHNFEFARKSSAPAPDFNRVEVKLDTLLAEIKMVRGLLQEMKEAKGFFDPLGGNAF